MTTGNNRKKVLIVGRMPQAGIDVLKKRDDVDYEILTDDAVPSLHPKLRDANAVTLGGTAFRQAELDAAPGMMVVARLGVGFDAVEIPALNKRKIPLMTTGIANSVSVAEHAMYMLLASARLTRWRCDTYSIPIDRELTSAPPAQKPMPACQARRASSTSR